MRPMQVDFFKSNAINQVLRSLTIKISPAGTLRLNSSGLLFYQNGFGLFCLMHNAVFEITTKITCGT